MGNSGISTRRRLYGLPLALALPFVGSRAVPPSANETAGARTPVPADSSVDLTSLARLYHLPALPAGGDAALDRITYLPGATLNLPAGGPVVYYVEHGVLDIRLPADNRARVKLPDRGDDVETTPDGFTRVPAGGSVHAPSGNLELTRNAGAEPAIALVMRLDPYSAGAAVVTKEAAGEPHGASRRRPRGQATRVAAETQASVESLANLPFAPGLEPDVQVWLDRVSYPPGATYVLSDAGPTILAVEEGAVDLLYQPGQPPGVGFAGTGPRLQMTPDGFVRLPAGASVSARDGRLGMTRNSSGAPASLLVVTLALDDLAAGMSEGSSKRAVPGERHRRHRDRAHDRDKPYATISPGADERPPWTDLTETGPLPAIPAGATAGLRRITLAPGEALDIGYAGPTLYYVVQGTLGVDSEHRQLRFVRVDGDGGGDGMPIGRNGEVPAGIGVYSADGNLGPTRNAGDGDLVILALLIAPQPSGTGIEQASGGMTVVATPDHDANPPREQRDRNRATPEPME